MKKRKSILAYILLFIGVIVIVNILADRFFLRLDFTADKRYTLSDATKNILKSLDETVTVTAYFSEELPGEFTQLRRDFKEELIEYSSRSKGKVMFEFINPNKDEATEQKAMQEGINPVLINVREKDQVKQQKAYLGAVVHYGDKKEVIPLIQPGAAMEYSLSTSIKKMSVDNKPTEATRRPRKEKSLLARALGYLARREHSRAVLERKLAPHAESADELQRLLDDLEAKKLLSDRRFTEVFSRSRGERFGAARVKQELRSHGIDDSLVREAVTALARTEMQRAKAVWRRKFDALPADPAERARQARFLAQRGFGGEVIRRVLGGRDED